MASAVSPTGSITEEIETLRERFANDCKVITQIGEFAYVVIITLKKWNFTVKFQIADSMQLPSAANIIVRSSGDSDFCASELQDYLQTKSFPSLSKAIDAAVAWLTERNPPVETLPVASQKKSKGNKNKKNHDVIDVVQKKSSMKTAEDVIKRILWDSNLRADEFSIGYLDRFLGVVEKNFVLFSWEDLASVDYTVLAIPKHRVQYFKYKTTKVWDKNERLDNMFGSTGGLTIIDVIRMAEEAQQAEGNTQPDAGTSEQTELKEDRGVEVDNKRSMASTLSRSDDDEDDDSDDESDDDDGVVVTVGAKGSSILVSDNIHADDDELDDDVIGGDDTLDVDKHWRNKLRPNYFLCQRVTDPAVIEVVRRLQANITDRCPEYVPCLIPATALHVTLCTLGLDTSDHVTEASQLLHSSREELRGVLGEGLSFELQGVGDFFNRVIYAKVNHNRQFTEYVEHLRALVRESGLNIKDTYDFVPHMTLMKVTRPVARATGRKTVPKWMCSEFKDWSFGRQAVDGVHLCEMKADKGVDGFYISPAHVDLI